MANVHSMPVEQYMGSWRENLQRIDFIGINANFSTWPKIGAYILKSNALGFDLDRSISGEAEILEKAKSLKSDDEKIAYIFDEVKHQMKWNGWYQYLSLEGNVRAWDKKTGNATEINMIIYHLLKKAGIKSYPLVVCTKNNGKINPVNPTFHAFNNTVVYVPVDSTKNYVLDASQKENLYNAIPVNILNTFGLSIDTHNILGIDQDEKNKAFQMVFISDDEPAMQSVSLNGEIKPDGKIDGTAEITSYKYNKERICGYMIRSAK